METFSALLAICAGISPVPKRQRPGALMFSLICVWINGWENNREAGDLRRYSAHYDVIAMNDPLRIIRNQIIIERSNVIEFVPKGHLASSVLGYLRTR